MNRLNSSTPLAADNLIRQFCQISRHLRAMRESLKRAAAAEGLNVSESIILLSCQSLAGNSESAGVPQQQLSQWTGMSAALVSTQLAALSVRELMIGHRPPTNRRVQIWMPSPRGAAIARILERGWRDELTVLGNQNPQTSTADWLAMMTAWRNSAA